jgi:alpha,alpha-trehalase
MTHRQLPALLKGIVRGLGLGRSERELTAADVAEARKYIADYWPKLLRKQKRDDDSLVGLPHPYLVAAYEPDHEFDFNEMYYWDTYFMSQSFFGPDNQKLLEGLLDNQVYLFERFGMVPNATRTYLTGRSQPPFMTSLIFEIFDTYHLDVREWLVPRIEVAKREYREVWMGSHKPHLRRVHHGLSRYYSPDMTHDQAEIESGWDYTPRFERRCLDFLPVDLNALLFKYETDFARAARLVGDETEAKLWDRAARKRRKTMTDLMWDRRRGLFYDYDYGQGHRGNISSLASYYCLWSGLATRRQARAMVRALHRFEHAGGLATTDDIPLNQRFKGGMPTQWAYPNGWAPLQYVTIHGLRRYGYSQDARRLAMKWLRTNLDWFNSHGVFLEKYNVVETDKPPAKGVYPSQTGFGWTNAIFERLCREYIEHRS